MPPYALEGPAQIAAQLDRGEAYRAADALRQEISINPRDALRFIQTVRSMENLSNRGRPGLDDIAVTPDPRNPAIEHVAIVNKFNHRLVADVCPIFIEPPVRRQPYQPHQPYQQFQPGTGPLPPGGYAPRSFIPSQPGATVEVVPSTPYPTTGYPGGQLYAPAELPVAPAVPPTGYVYGSDGQRVATGTFLGAAAGAATGAIIDHRHPGQGAKIGGLAGALGALMESTVPPPPPPPY